MQSRRIFIGKVASGLAGTLAVPSSVLGANERVRMGIVGAGDRGLELVRWAIATPGVEFAAFCDIYTKRLETAKRIVPEAATYMDHRRLLDDKSIDAVIIATPQHLHCEHFTAALDAGKHVYQEKTMAFTVEHAKRMRTAFQRDGGKHTVQIGHQSCSSGQMTDALSFLKPEMLGRITAIHAHMYRNTPHGKPQWERKALLNGVNPDDVLWNAFLGDAPKRPFDANRFIHWRYFWDYSGGNVYENMCHQVAFWYRAMNLQIPKAVTMNGGLYLWKDGREVPDTMNVAMEQPEEILFSWDSGFGNSALGSSEHILGTDGTIEKNAQIRYSPQKVNLPNGQELLGRSTESPSAHMQNFVDCIRTGKQPNCPFETGFRVSIACRMAVESYRQGKTMRWDPVREEIA